MILIATGSLRATLRVYNIVSVYDVNAVTDLFFLLHFFEGLSLDGSSGSLLVEIFVINRRFVDSEKGIKNGVKNDNIFQ